MQGVEQEISRDKYSAEAGLEEAYAKIQLEVKEALKAGESQVKEGLTNEWNKEEYTTYIHDAHGNIIGEKFDQGLLEDFMNSWFQAGYSNYINSNLEQKVEKEEEYIANKLLQDQLTIECNTHFTFQNSDTFVIQVKSTFTSIQGVDTTLSRYFDISLATYNQPYYLEEIYYDFDSFKIDGFEDNALTSGGSIYIEEGDLTILDGQVYSGGASTASEVGGIYLEGDNFTLYGGDMITSKNIRVANGNMQARINGDVYCNNLIIDNSSVGALLQIGEGGSQSSDKYRVLTEDDLELNGRQSHIKIYGSYYGFSVGIQNTVNLTHDQSSAIIANTPDIGQGSSLLISGESTDHDKAYEPGGILIGGTSYMDFNQYDSYQTGESLSLGGNYLAYMPQVVDRIKDQVKVTLDMQFDITSDSYREYVYSIDDETELTMPMLEEYTMMGIQQKVTAKMKGEFLKEAFDTSAFNVQVGWNQQDETGVSLSNVKYATGAYMTQGTVKNDKKAFLSYAQIMDKLRDDYRMRTAPIDMVDSYEHSEDIEVLTADSLVYVNADDEPIALIGDGGSLPQVVAKAYNIGNSIKGILITAGDIYLSGNFFYQGIIATSGDIYIMDDKEKTIKLDQDVRIKGNSTLVGANEEVANRVDYSQLIRAYGWERE